MKIHANTKGKMSGMKKTERLKRNLENQMKEKILLKKNP